MDMALMSHDTCYVAHVIPVRNSTTGFSLRLVVWETICCLAG